MAVQMNISWDTIGPFLVWQFLIPLAAGWMQGILYAIFIRAGDSKPQPGSARFIRHQRQLLTAIYVAYLAFIIYEVDFKLQKSSNAYTDLGVPINVNDSGLASRFRKLTVRFHPDKIGPNVDRDQANEYYIHLKHSRDIIRDPAKRFAYDRFGPDILRQCSHCLTVKEYTNYALLVVLYTYGALVAFLFGANALGFLKDGAYWRYLAVLAIATYEVRTALRPDHPPFLTNYLNPMLSSTGVRPHHYLPFEATTLIRRATLSAAQFLGLIMPLWREDPRKPAKPVDDSEEARHKQLQRLENSIGQSAGLATRLVQMESMPYLQNRDARADLKIALRDYMTNNAIHMDKEVRNAMGETVAKRRTGAPSGARGTK